jgi:hypothetical protein
VRHYVDEPRVGETLKALIRLLEAGVSKLPRMIGKPSLPLPMTTTFELGDCES